MKKHVKLDFINHAFSGGKTPKRYIPGGDSATFDLTHLRIGHWGILTKTGFQCQFASSGGSIARSLGIGFQYISEKSP